MDVTRKTLIATFIVNLLLIAISVVCLFVLKFNTVSLCLFAGVAVCVAISSVMIWKFGQNFKK